MKIELIQEQTFTVKAGGKAIRGMVQTDSWEGLIKLQDSTGNSLILNDGVIVRGSVDLLSALAPTANSFVQVPETKLPNGLTVSAFQVAQYISTKTKEGRVGFDVTSMPWANINYFDAIKASKEAGYNLITETQWLAIAWNLSQQDCNWTGGKVGDGDLYQGIRNGGGAKPAGYLPEDANTKRWMTLSNGQQVCDFNGNVFQWVLDDIQGDEKGVIAKAFDISSPSLTVPPYPSRIKGTGWRPDPGADWSGYALVRGGCWDSGGYAGVFYLDHGGPRCGDGGIGFRCTLP